MLCTIYRDEVPVRDGQRESKIKERKIKDNVPVRDGQRESKRKKRKIKDIKSTVIRKQNNTDEDSNSSSIGKYNND